MHSENGTVRASEGEADAPKVSIIIPIFNGSGHLENIMRFLDEQRFRDFEVVFVVDSKTEDDSEDSVRAIADRRENVRVIIQTGGGKLGGARNIGVMNSAGRLLWFLDVDDRPHPDYLHDLVRIQDENDSDITSCSFVYVDSVDGRFPKERDYRVIVMDRSRALDMRSMERFPVSAWSGIFKRSLMEENNLWFENSYAEDIKFMYRAISLSKTVCYYDRPLYLYVESRTSRRRRTENLHGEAELETYDELEDYFKDTEFSGRFERRSSLLRIRSSGHMDYKGFMEYARSGRCRDMIERNLSYPLSPEALWYRVSPSTYYVAIQVFFKLLYYRNGRRFGSGLLFLR